MKNIILILFLAILIQPLCAQKKIILHKTDNTKQGFVISAIDSLKFGNSETTIDIYKKDNSSSSLQISNVDSVTMEEILPTEYPVIRTISATSISYTTAISGINIKYNGMLAINEKGICWSTVENPTINDSKISSTSTKDSANLYISGLTGATTYYVRAYAKNDAGIVYGTQISLTTLAYVLPTVSLSDVSLDTQTANTLKVTSKISSSGGCSLTERGICWSTTNTMPTIDDSKYASGKTVGTFYSYIANISTNATYYVRSYAINCVGTSYSSVSKYVVTPGHVTYTLAVDSATYPTYYNLLKIALDSACYYYNRYTTFGGNIYVYYNSGIPTAQASYHGSIGFGPSTSYMHVATTMHEMAHFFGSGTTSSWKALLVNGVWTGTAAAAMCSSFQGEVLKGDNNSTHIHFWPYGLNYRSEATSVDVYIRHCKIVDAMKTDCGWPNP